MATFEKFEDLEVWKQSMELCTKVYELTNKYQFSKDYALKDQVRKSAISIPSNISEGFERNGKKQFLYFLVISKGSCGELRTQLKIANDLKYISEKDFDIINGRCLLVSKQLSGFINYLRNKSQ